MICASEVKEKAIIAKHQMEEQKKQEREQAERERQVRIKRSITHCETAINQELLHAAKHGLTSITLHYGTDNYHRGVQHVTKDSVKYANGKPSYSGRGDFMELSAIINYLKEHCFSVSSKSWFYMSFGSGRLEGYELTISVPSKLQCD